MTRDKKLPIVSFLYNFQLDLGLKRSEAVS